MICNVRFQFGRRFFRACCGRATCRQRSEKRAVIQCRCGAPITRVMPWPAGGARLSALTIRISPHPLAPDSNRQATEAILHQRYAALNAVMQYDCSRFDKFGLCVQSPSRATGSGAQSTGAGGVQQLLRPGANRRAACCQCASRSVNSLSSSRASNKNIFLFGSIGEAACANRSSQARRAAVSCGARRTTRHRSIVDDSRRMNRDARRQTHRLNKPEKSSRD